MDNNILKVSNSDILPADKKEQKEIANNIADVECPIVFITKDDRAYRQQTPYSSVLTKYADNIVSMASHPKLLAEIANLPIESLMYLHATDSALYATMLAAYITRSSYDVFCSVIDNSDVGNMYPTYHIKEILNINFNDENKAFGFIRTLLNDYAQGSCSSYRLLYPEVNNNISAGNVDAYLSVIGSNICHIIYSAIMYAIDDGINPEPKLAKFITTTYDIKFKDEDINDRNRHIILKQYLKTRFMELVDRAVMPSITSNLESLTRYIRYAPIGVYGAMLDANRYDMEKERTKLMAEKELKNMQ